MRDDAARFAQIAGSASAGDYGLLTEKLPCVGSRVFAQMVGDALEEKGLTDAKYVWTKVVLNAGTLEDVGVAFMNGNTDEAYKVAKKEVLAKLKAFSEESVAGLIN